MASSADYLTSLKIRGDYEFATSINVDTGGEFASPTQAAFSRAANRTSKTTPFEFVGDAEAEGAFGEGGVSDAVGLFGDRMRRLGTE
jgi:hypothetical protein